MLDFCTIVDGQNGSLVTVNKKKEQARQTYQLHKSIKAILGSVEADIQEIQKADDIHLHAISVIQNALGLP